MGESKIVCGFCDNLVAKDIFWDHIGGNHLNYRPFDCTTCKAKFVNGSELAFHETDSAGHVGNYNPKKNALKEEILRHIFSLCVKANRESGKSKPMGETPENANNDESSAIAPADEAILSVQIPSFGESENGANDCLQQTETHSPPPSEQDQPSTSVAAEQIQSIGEHNSNVDESPESECLTNAINGQRQNSVENDTLQNASNVRQEAEVLESDSVAAAGAKLPFYFNVLQTIKDELERRLKAQNGPAQMNSSLSQLSASNAQSAQTEAQQSAGSSAGFSMSTNQEAMDVSQQNANSSMEAQMINSFATILQMQQSEPTTRLQTSTDAMSNNSSTCPGFASFPSTLPVISLHSQQQQQNEIPLLVDSNSGDGSRASCTKKRPRLNGKQTDAGSAKSVGESDERETYKKVRRQKKAKNDQRNVIVKREVVHEACRECGKLVGASNDSLILHINHCHMKLPIYTCPLCSKVFYSFARSIVNTHIRRCIATRANGEQQQENEQSLDLQPISHKAANYPLLRNSIQKYFG